MGFLNKLTESVKNIYYFFENKWYNILDKIDKYVPVYKIIDPIDKVVPSFILFLLFSLFILFLIVYLFNFYSPYEVTFSAFDSKTKAALVGVNIFGQINGEDFDILTAQDGTAAKKMQGRGKNTFIILGEIFFGSNEEILAVLSAEKEGYNKIVNQEVRLESKSAKISLTPRDTIDLKDKNYADLAVVELVDSVSEETLIDDTGSAYVKFKCGNKNDSPKRVLDNEDGVIDGFFELKSSECEFIIVEAKSPGYEDISGASIALQKNKQNHQLSMTKINIPTTGTAKIFVSEKNSSPKKMVPRIEVKLLDDQSNTAATFTTNTSGVALKQELAPGVYTITLSSLDNNYYPIGADANIKISITAGLISEKEVEVTKLDPSLARVARIKVIDSVDKSAIIGAKVFAQRVSVDSNGHKYANGSIGSCSNSCLTDSNGQLSVTGLTVNDDGNIVLSIYKEGYLFKAIKPVLFRLTEGPETVELEKEIPPNSSRAVISVKALQNQRPIISAKAFLYSYPADLGIEGINLLEAGVLTDSNGKAVYLGLGGGTYSAKATFSNSSSPLSAKKAVDLNQTVYFDLNIDTASSFLKINLVDTNGIQIASQSAARIALYAVTGYDYDTAFTKPPTEILQYSASSNAFISTGYEINRRFIADINLANYVNSFVDVQTISAGENSYTVRMYKKDEIKDQNGKDLNVTVFFNGLFKDNADLIAGTKATFLDINNSYDGTNKGYYSKVDLVIGQDLSYSELFGAQLVSSTMSIVNVPQKTEPFLSTLALYTCSLAEKSPISDDNFFIQTNNLCAKTSVANIGKQLGIKWDGALRQGVYSFTARMNFTSAATEDGTVDLNIVGKERHPSYVSQQKKSESFRISRPLCNSAVDANCPKIFFDVELNGEKIGPADMTYDSSTKTFSYPQIIRLPSEQANSFKIKLYNDSQTQISASMKAYSYAGTKNQFNESASGLIHFNSLTGEKSKVLSSNEVIPMESYSALHDANIFPEVANSSNYIVIVAETQSGKYTLFIDTLSPGRRLILSGARFLAGVPDQNFDSEVVTTATTPAALRRVVLEVKKACNTSTPIKVHEIDAQISGNYFIAKIPGTYTYGEDCIDITAVPEDTYYEDLMERVFAGSGGIQDPGLACLDASLVGSQSPLEMQLLWAKSAQLRIVNHCQSRMEIQVKTGLVSSTACSSLEAGQECIVNIEGKNIEYSNAVQFSDVLGIFPVYVNARKVNSGKKFALAQKALIHLINPSECFVIAKDVYDLLQNPNDTGISIQNECQYTLIEDYYIPKTTSSIINADLNEKKPTYGEVSFDYDLVVTGGGYNVTYEDSIVSTYSITNELGHDHFAGIENEKGKYTNFKVTLPVLDARSSKMMFKWIDNAADTNEYGAKIDGNVVVTYKNGTKVSINPKTTFNIDNEIKCECNGVVAQGNACTNPTNVAEHCLMGQEEAENYDDGWDSNYMYGLAYVFYPEGEITSIDFNVIGNPDSNYLIIVTETWFTFTEKVPIVTQNNDTDSNVFDSGSFNIYPLEGVVYLLKNYANAQVSPEVSDEVRLCKEVLKGNAWITDSNIYFTKREYNNRDGALDYCASSTATYFDNPSSLVQSSTTFSQSLLTDMKQSLTDANWLDSGSGFWSGGCFSDSIIGSKNLTISCNAQKDYFNTFVSDYTGYHAFSVCSEEPLPAGLSYFILFKNIRPLYLEFTYGPYNDKCGQTFWTWLEKGESYNIGVQINSPLSLYCLGIPENFNSDFTLRLISAVPVDPRAYHGTYQCETLVWNSTDNNLFSSFDNSEVVNKYAPLCTAIKPAQISEAGCNSWGLDCDPKSGLCASSDILSIDAFNSSAFMNKTNPSVEAVVTGVNSGETQLNNGSVIVWFEAGLLKAMFLGEDYEGYNDGSIESTLVDNGITGEQYGKINILDYVNRGRTKN